MKTTTQSGGERSRSCAELTLRRGSVKLGSENSGAGLPMTGDGMRPLSGDGSIRSPAPPPATRTSPGEGRSGQFSLAPDDGGHRTLRSGSGSDGRRASGRAWRTSVDQTALQREGPWETPLRQRRRLCGFGRERSLLSCPGGFFAIALYVDGSRIRSMNRRARMCLPRVIVMPRAGNALCTITYPRRAAERAKHRDQPQYLPCLP